MFDDILPKSKSKEYPPDYRYCEHGCNFVSTDGEHTHCPNCGYPLTINTISLENEELLDSIFGGC